MSASRLTRPPTASAPSVVSRRVVGMAATSNHSPPTAATVRLTPATATEPLRTVPRAKAGEQAKRSRKSFPSGRLAASRPTSSTCPETMCPPSRSPSRSARSRFRPSPARRSPSIVQRSVSSSTSASKPSGAIAVTVRHAPFTATLSPKRSGSPGAASRGARTASVAPVPRGLRPSVFPMHWTKPVNMTPIVTRARAGRQTSRRARSSSVSRPRTSPTPSRAQPIAR